MSPTLSVCIPTFSNPDGVKETLEKMIAEAETAGFFEEVEFCIADNSEDELTETIVSSVCSQSNVHVRYQRHGKNIGYDRNVDAVIKLARGKYCWFLSDNEDVKTGAFSEILKEVRAGAADLIVICPSSVVPARLKTYSNLEEAIKANDWWIPGGLVSRNIVKRSLIPADLSVYFGNYWLHLSITTLVAADRPVRFIAEKFHDDGTGKVRWAKNGTTFLTYTNLIVIIEKLPQPPYSPDFIATMTKKMRRGLPHNILSAKLYGLVITRDHLKRLYVVTRHDPLYMILSFLAMMIPAVLVTYAKRIKQSIGH